MSDRIPCIVPGCRRTAPPERGHTRIICGKHWAAIPRRERWLYYKVNRKARRIGWTDALCRIAHFHWPRLERIAIERAMGIA